MRYTVVCECSFDDVNGEYATYALAWGEACVHDVSVDAAFVQRVADALNGQDVPPEHVYNVLDNFYGMGEAAPVTRRWWERTAGSSPPRPPFWGFCTSQLAKKGGRKSKTSGTFYENLTAAFPLCVHSL